MIVRDGDSRVQDASSDTTRATWPSGEGIEYGTVSLPLKRVAYLANEPIIEDDGVFAVILDPGPEMPVTFVSEPNISGLVAIIADKSVDSDMLHSRVELLIKPSDIHWHDAASSLSTPADERVQR